MGKRNCFLSKCRYLNGVKCLKLAWYECNQSATIPGPDAQTRAVFNRGHFIGEKAKAYFPDGVENTEPNFNGHLQKSLAWLERKTPLFEVAYMADNLYARPDIIRPDADGTWDIIEVKCNTEIDEVSVRDIAYQYFVLTRAGLRIKNLFLMHPNPDIRVGCDSIPAEIFILEDVTERAGKYLPELEKDIELIRNTCAEDNPPIPAIGDHCEKPYKCPMFDICWEVAVVDVNDAAEHFRELQITEIHEVDGLIRLAMEYCTDNFDSVALHALQKAIACAEFSTDYCNLAIAFYRLKLSDELRDKMISLALNTAKLPADFEEIVKVEKQVKAGVNEYEI